MGTSLTGLTPAATYQGLIKFGDNSAISAVQRYLSDGLGNDLPIAVSSTKVGIGTTTGTGVLNVRGTDGSSSNYTLMASSTTANFYIRNDGFLYNAEQARLSNVLIANLAGNSIHSTLSGSGGGALFLGALGTAITNTTGLTPTAMAHVKGSGSTSATTSLLVQNSGGTQLFKAFDDGVIEAGGATANQFKVMNTEGLAISRDGSLDANIRIREFSGSGPVIKLNGNSTPTFKFIDSSNFQCILSHATWTGIGKGVVENTSAALQVESTTKGFLPPKMTDAQVRAISTPANGLVVYNTTIDYLCVYQAGAWVKISHSPM